MLFSLFSRNQNKRITDEKEPKENLQMERDQMELIISSMAEGLIVVDMNAKITLINPTAQKLLEIKNLSDILGKSWSEIVSTIKKDKEVPVSERSFSQVLKIGKAIVTKLSDDHYYLTKSNRKFPISSITAPIFSGGKITGAVKVFRDDSFQKELEGQLKKEKERVELIISSIAEGLICIDNNFKLTLINSKAEELLGITAKDAVGRTWSDLTIAFVNNQEIPFENRISVKVVKEGKTIVTRIEDNHFYAGRNNKKFPVASITAPLVSEKGEIIGSVKVFRDATNEKYEREIIENEVKDRTRQVREEHTRLTASIDSLTLGYVLTDANDNLIVANKKVSEIIPHKTDVDYEIILNQFLDLKNRCKKCRRLKKTLIINDVEIEGKILRLFLTPVISESVVIGAVVLIEDTTEVKLLERAKDEFFAVASHELRTPLTAIRGNTSLIQTYFSEKINDPNLNEMITDIHDASTRLISIVGDFLDVSRLEYGKIKFKKEIIDIGDLILSVIEELKTTASAKGLNLTFEKPQEPHQILADKDRTKQVLVNVIGNGIKFTKTGGVTVQLKKIDSRVKVEITDTGLGISLQNQRLLFRKFQQAGEQILSRDMTQGTGMGLYISRLLCEGMGGKIYVETSGLGKGSTFAFELPAAAVAREVVSVPKTNTANA